MRDILTRGLAQLGLPADAVPQLEAYAALLLEKNKVMNLTAITAPQEVATLHLLDCAALLTMADLRGKRVIDVGTGGRVPRHGAADPGAGLRPDAAGQSWQARRLPPGGVRLPIAGADELCSRPCRGIRRRATDSSTTSPPPVPWPT